MNILLQNDIFIKSHFCCSQAEKEEYSLCYKGVNHILKKIATCNLPNTFTLLKATLALALTCVAKWESPDQFIKQLVYHLLSWIKGTHGSEPSELEIAKEVQVYVLICVYIKL